MTSDKLSQHIFRQYDIRGIVGEDLDADVAEAVGRAFGSHLRAISEKQQNERPRTAVGHDNRLTSPELSEGLVRGIRASGVDVLDVGLVPTPMLYWAGATLGTDGSVQITGSHNPPEWNGIKMNAGGGSLYGEGIQDLWRRIVEGDLLSGQGSLERIDVLDRYIVDLSGRFELSRPLRVAVDAGNGTGSIVAVPLLEALGAEVIPLFCESDGTFPNHHPDPTVDENLEVLIRTVKEEGLDLGIAFDGDADRIGVVDENGTIVRGDVLLLLLGLDLLRKRGAPQKLIFDVKCSQVIPEVFAEAGGEPIMWKTGHSLIKKKMRETGAPLAGELSGHIMIADDYYGFDDAPYVACRLIDLVARSGRPLSAMTAEFPTYVSTAEIRIDVTEEQKWVVVEAAVEHFKKDHEVIDVDGARILFGDGWALLRTSNTQPVIVSRYEARTAARLAHIRDEVERWLAAQGVDA